MVDPPPSQELKRAGIWKRSWRTHMRRMLEEER